MIVFWVFMLVMDLLIPAAMIGIGSVFMKKPPVKISCVYGYRTAASMKNRDTWEFAHKYCGRLFRMIGWILIPVSVLPLLVVWGKDVETVGTVGAVITCAQIIPMVLPIIPTERALKKVFDQNGRRRNG